MVRDISAQKPVRIVIDSNVFIAAESVSSDSHLFREEAARFLRLASQLNCSVAVCEATKQDLLRAQKPLQDIRLRQLEKYHVLENIPVSTDLHLRAKFPIPISRNNQIDLAVLAVLDSGAVDWLVTQDNDFRRRAANAGYRDQTLSLADATETMLVLSNQSPPMLTVNFVKGYQILPDVPLLIDIQDDYPDFIKWWKTKVAKGDRDVVVLGPTSDPEAISVLKIEEDNSHGISGRTLKICTFKVGNEFANTRRGELILNASIEYARKNRCKSIYLEVIPSKLFLLDWLRNFGFEQIHGASNGQDVVMLKQLIPQRNSDSSIDPLDYNIRFGPGAIKMFNPYLVPVRTEWHSMLFPEAGPQRPLLARQDPCGNAIRKVYLCTARSQQVTEGSVLVFLQTNLPGVSTISAIGVTEQTHTSSDPSDLLSFAGNRTVYAFDQLRSMCQDHEVLAIRFRLDRILNPSWTLNELQTAGLVLQSPQTMQRVREEGVEWLARRLVTPS